MEYREKIEWLKRYRYYTLEEKRLIEEQKEWYNRANRLNPRYSDLPKAHEMEDVLQKAVEQMIECGIRASEEALKSVAAQIEILTAINDIQDSRYKMVLRLRYISLNTQEQTADIMGYDVKHLQRLQKEAIEAISI